MRIFFCYSCSRERGFTVLPIFILVDDLNDVFCEQIKLAEDCLNAISLTCTLHILELILRLDDIDSFTFLSFLSKTFTIIHL